ncbi:TniB protein [Krasilnikovia cinnamomea]|uniref:TniB protein n=1 Tax=Krasilnikovia cinnamomea TaxID=349313 RepID=A0A4Q7ZJW7_9ACTN|nr:ATP-binding protein [Krasilnikovia cinnamomea]RZU51197.1 TniB protein [Krasilnikovia cinnamomea]
MVTAPSQQASSTDPGQGGSRPPLDDEDRHRQLTTREGWRRFTDEAATDLVVLTEPQWRRLAEDERTRYDEERIDHHARLIVIATSAVRRIVTAGRRLTMLNRHAISARRGLVVSGAAGTGKTTAITQLGKTHELIDRQRHPGQTRIPTVFVTVPPAATARMLAVEFARFLGIPVAPRQNITDVTEAVCGVLCAARTGLVIVDEIHNLNLATRSGAEVSDQLKYFSERITATFVYAGINVQREGLFSGTRGQQIAGRFSMIPTVTFPYQQEWAAVVATLEQALRLHHHPIGSLVKLDRYLHQRTKGMIGSLSHLIRGSAIEAILDGTEQITKQTLESIDLDYAATTTTLPDGR